MGRADTLAAAPDELETLTEGLVAPTCGHVDRVLAVAHHRTQPPVWRVLHLLRVHLARAQLFQHHGQRRAVCAQVLCNKNT